MKIFKITSIFLFLVHGINSNAQESFFLECKGFRWWEINGQFSTKDREVQTYEIKNQNLVFSQDEKYHIVPISFGKNEISYSAYQHPTISIIKNYYLQFDIISGVVKERYDSYPPDKNIISYWKFEGVCIRTTRKF